MELNLHDVKSEGGEIVVRTGTAPNVYDPTNVSLSGIISAPSDWVEKRNGSKSEVSTANAHVVANYTGRSIILRTDERSKFGDTITGRLEEFPDLKKLAVNTERTYTEKQLFSLIKFYGIYFEQKFKYEALLDKLKRFEAKVDHEFQNSDDLKGASAYKKITTITTELELSFGLTMPVFTGGDKQTFLVDINVGLQDGVLAFWLESVQLADLQKSLTEKIFEEQLKRFEDFAVVKQW